MLLLLIALTTTLALSAAIDTSLAGPIPTKIHVALTRHIKNPGPKHIEAPDVSYFGAVGFGQPAQVFNVVFDTGSKEIWLPAYNWFPLANNLHYSTGYKCGDSSECRPENNKFTIDYRGTKLSGETYSDVMTTYEGVSKEDIPVVSATTFSYEQNFLAITNAGDAQFRHKPYDGVVGLPPVGSSSGVRNMMLSFEREQRIQSGTTPASVADIENNNRFIFAFWFNPDLKSRQGGELTLGGVNESKFTGPIKYHPINSDFEWQVQLSYVALGGRVISCDQSCNVTLETGISSLVGPSEDLQAIVDAFQAKQDVGSGLYFVECSKREMGAPAISFNIDGTPYNLSPREFIKTFKYQEKPVCYLDIKPSNARNWRLGTTFLGSFYTVFDQRDEQVGFATPRNQL